MPSSVARVVGIAWRFPDLRNLGVTSIHDPFCGFLNLQAQLPTLRFIHLIRDGRDMAFSEIQNQLRLYGQYLLDSRLTAALQEAGAGLLQFGYLAHG